jgi:methanogenic corrinoid protein MtbC1
VPHDAVLAAPEAGGPLRWRRRVAAVARAIETDIIPRLLRAQGGFAAASSIDSAPRRAVQGADVEAICGLAMRADWQGAIGYLEALRGRGIPLARLYLDLLAPAARRLGAMWEEEACDFAAVTIGLGCLHQVLQNYQADAVPWPRGSAPGRRILLAPAPGEQHRFGLLIVEHFFREAGWDVWSGADLPRAEMLAALRRGWFGAAGFSLSCDDHVEALAALIRQVRAASDNPDIAILVGGPALAGRPELRARVGADVAAADAAQAVVQADTMLALLGHEA